MAAVLVTGTVVPALAVIRDSMSQSRQLHQRKLLASFAVLLLEEQTALGMMNWTNTTDTGDFTSHGYPGIAYSLLRSDDPGDGGVVDQLMHIEVTVFNDIDADQTLDLGEQQVQYRTKIANLNTYQNVEQ